MSQLLKHFRRIREEFIKAVDDFPKEKREEVLFDKWNLKQVLIHISQWDKALAENMIDLKKGKEPPHYGKVDAFNQNAIKLGQDWSWGKAYQEFVEQGKKLVVQYESLPNNLWEAKYWKDKSSTPLKFLKVNLKHYEEEHLPLLQKFVRPR